MASSSTADQEHFTDEDHAELLALMEQPAVKRYYELLDMKKAHTQQMANTLKPCEMRLDRMHQALKQIKEEVQNTRSEQKESTAAAAAAGIRSEVLRFVCHDGQKVIAAYNRITAGAESAKSSRSTKKAKSTKKAARSTKKA